MELSRKKTFIWNVLYVACIAAIVYLIFQYCIALVAPFLAAFVVSALVVPLVDFLHRKVHIAKRFSAVLLVTIAYLILTGLLILIGVGVYRWAMNADGWFQTVFVPLVFDITGRVGELLNGYDAELLPSLTSMRDTFIQNIGSKVSAFSAEFLSRAASGLPSFLIGVIFAIVATYFMATDADRIKRYIATRQTESLYTTLSAAYLSLKATLGKYVRAYALIFLITFAELTVGFLCAGIQNFVLIALLVAVFDILPILGSSMILLPWSVILLLTGDYTRGAILFAVYLVVVIVRQFMEPKIVGEHVGLHPLVTLIAMYVGAKLFGGVGLLGFPITCAVIVQVQRAGFLTGVLPQRREYDPREDPFVPKTKESPKK